MAGIYSELFRQDFTATDTIDIPHNVGREFYTIRVVIGDVERSDLIESMSPHETDPTNRVIVKLVSAQTGFVQVLSADLFDVTDLSSTQRAQHTLDVSGLLELTHVNQLNGLSGVVEIESLSTALTVATSGQDINLDIDITELQSLLTLSGIGQLSEIADAGFQSTSSTTLVTALSMNINTNASGLYRLMWSMEASCDKANKSCQFAVELDNATVDRVMDVNTSFNIADGNLPFGGFIHRNLGSGLHTLDVLFRFNDVGIGSAQLRNASLEALRLGEPSGV